MFYDRELIKIKNGNIVSINEELDLNFIKGQIIAPLIMNDKLIGSLVCFNTVEEFENYDFQFAAIAIKHIKILINSK